MEPHILSTNKISRMDGWLDVVTDARVRLQRRELVIMEFWMEFTCFSALLAWSGHFRTWEPMSIFPTIFSFGLRSCNPSPWTARFSIHQPFKVHAQLQLFRFLLSSRYGTQASVWWQMFSYPCLVWWTHITRQLTAFLNLDFPYL